MIREGRDLKMADDKADGKAGKLKQVRLQIAGTKPSLYRFPLRAERPGQRKLQRGCVPTAHKGRE